MTFKLWVVKNDTMTNITPIVGNIQWTSNVDTLGQQLDFSASANDDRFFPRNPIEVGDMVVFQNQDEIFRGIIVTEGRNGKFERQYTCFDPAFYLNKSKDIFQFNGEKANKAIEKMLKAYEVPVGQIVSIPVEIDKVFTNTISENIKEILEIAQKQTGIKYRLEMRAGQLYIEKQTDLVVTGSFKLVTNMDDIDIQASISNPSRTLSIEEMRNRIKIVKDDKVITTVENGSLIDQYGLLTEVLSIDEKEAPKAKSIAQNLLSELGRVFEECSITMLGDERIRAGRILKIEEPNTGMSGQYLITSAAHTLTKGTHTMSLNLEAV